MSLPNPGNDSPLSYGILAYGNDASSMPEELFFEQNEIYDIVGAGISLGSWTNFVSINDNHIHDIAPVEYLGQSLSVGVQSQFAQAVQVEGNTFDGLVIGSNLLLSSGIVGGNLYNGVASFLTTTSPSSIDFNDPGPWWLAVTSVEFEGLPFTLNSYASTFEYATLVADDGSTIVTDSGEEIVQDCAGQWDGTAVEDCEGVCGGDAVVDECNVCNGDGSSCQGTVAVQFNSDRDIAGFQFNVNGVDVTGVSGGAAEAAGFTVSNSSSVVIGFSLTGSTIPAGEGVLTKVSFDSATAGEEICFGVVTMSDPFASAIDFDLGGCYTGEVTTCDDMGACNYEEEGDCEYADFTCCHFTCITTT
jgi:hypothetical protein